jgi:hypothetical protein
MGLLICHHCYHVITKGENLRTEMFSALKACVKDPKDHERTSLNVELLNTLLTADKVVRTYTQHAAFGGYVILYISHL